jgi:predicted cupin superfamily sugar epimerase
MSTEALCHHQRALCRDLEARGHSRRPTARSNATRDIPNLAGGRSPHTRVYFVTFTAFVRYRFTSSSVNGGPSSVLLCTSLLCHEPNICQVGLDETAQGGQQAVISHGHTQASFYSRVKWNLVLRISRPSFEGSPFAYRVLPRRQVRRVCRMNGGARFDHNLQCFWTYICVRSSGGHIRGNTGDFSRLVRDINM